MLDLLPLFLLLNILKILTLKSLVGCTKQIASEMDFWVDCWFLWFSFLALNFFTFRNFVLPLTFEGNVFVLLSVSSHLFLSLPSPTPQFRDIARSCWSLVYQQMHWWNQRAAWLCSWSSGSFCSLISTLLDPHFWFKAIVLVRGLGSLFYQSPVISRALLQP